MTDTNNRMTRSSTGPLRRHEHESDHQRLRTRTTFGPLSDRFRVVVFDARGRVLGAVSEFLTGRLGNPEQIR